MNPYQQPPPQQGYGYPPQQQPQQQQPQAYGGYDASYGYVEGDPSQYQNGQNGQPQQQQQPYADPYQYGSLEGQYYPPEQQQQQQQQQGGYVYPNNNNLSQQFGAMSMGGQQQPAPSPTSQYSSYPPPQPQGPYNQQAYNQTPSASSPNLAANAQRRRLNELVKPVNFKYLSLTINAAPASQALRTSSKLPYGVIVQPLADTETELAVVNFGSVGVVRCVACRAYINPYALFVDGGASWICNICNKSNEVPSSYFAPLDGDGRRVDINDRPELRDASVEIVAPGEYMMRQPMPPTYVFCIDVSQTAVQSGMLRIMVETVKSTLEQLPGGERTMVGFVTFDSNVHFYTLRPSSKLPQVFVMTDLEDIFTPLPSDLLVNLEECRPQVLALLNALPNMYAKTTNLEAAVGPALEAALQMMGHIGGKLLVFLGGLPSIGPGRLSNREEPRQFGTAKEHVNVAPFDDFYKKKAVRMSRYQVCADTFFFASSFVDVSSVGEVSRYTGGQTYYYPNFNMEVDGTKFAQDLYRNLTRTTGWEAVVRVRASNGVKTENVYGNLFLRGSDLIALPAVDCDKAIALELKNEEKALECPFISIQSALLYSTSFGERRIRVHTAYIPVTTNIADLYASANSNALINLVAKQAAERALIDGFQKSRDLIRASIISAIRTYRAISKSIQLPNTPEQLPEHLVALPIMCLGLIKTPAFREGSDVRCDERASALSEIRSMGLMALETFVRPRMLPLHMLSGSEGLYAVENQDPSVPIPPYTPVYLPPEVNLSVSSLSTNSAFLIDNGLNFYLRLGRQTPPEFLMELFGVQSLYGLTGRQLRLRDPTEAHPQSLLARVHNILNYLRSVSSVYQNLIIFVEGDKNELVFSNLLIEDRNGNTESLNDFLHHVFAGTTF